MTFLLSIFLIILGLSGAIFGIVDFFNTCKCCFWSQTIGIIKQAIINEIKSEATSSFIPEVKYEFNVSGISFTSDRIFFGLTFNLSKFEANQFIVRIPENSKVKVYYNRFNPNQSVLVAKNFKTALLKLWFSILPLVIGGLLIFSIDPNYIFWFFLLWFLPVIFLTYNYEDNPYNNIKILDNEQG
jgi:hypothetical protein